MSVTFRFAVISDLHIAMPHTVWNHPSRFHLVEVSIPALEAILEHLNHLDLDFLLLPGDLTQHGEPDNHQWLANRLAQLPYPVYVVPGNHDVPSQLASDRSIGLENFTAYYQKFGYEDPTHLDYTHEILPGVRLVGLNSNHFSSSGEQLGCLMDHQLVWLRQVLSTYSQDLILVMIHHNVIEHLPGQTKSDLGRRYMLDNAPEFLAILREAGVQLVFTGHLHIQDIAHHQGVYDITTGSLVTYPHAYRVLQFSQDAEKRGQLEIVSHRVEAVPGWETLQQTSREWMGDRSGSFVLKLLTSPPLNLSHAEASTLVPDLRYFWADIAYGDPFFQFPQFPPAVKRYIERFNAVDQVGNPAYTDNNTVLHLD